MGGSTGAVQGPEPATRHPWLIPSLDDADRSDHTAGRVGRSSREWTVDAGCFLLATAAAAAVLLGDMVATPPVGGWLLAADGAGAVVACAALWARRGWPVAVALGLLAVSTLAPSATVAAGIAAFTVAVHRRFRLAATVCALSVAAAVVRDWLRPPGLMPYGAWLLVSALAAVAVLAWGMFARARRRLMHSLRERAVKAEAEQVLRSQQARRAERDRLAREMHDVLAHRLSLLSLQAGALEFRPDATPADVATAARVIRASAHQALDDLREVIAVLREGPDDGQEDLGGTRLADVPALVHESRQPGVPVELADQLGEGAAVPDRVGRTAYHLVREALTNARKHAPGCPVTVRLAGAPGSGLTVEVHNPLPHRTDEAPGIPGTGTGLVGLGERAALVGGRLEHGSTESGEFRVHAWLPWPP